MQKAYQSNRADLLILHGNSKFAEIFWYFGYFQNGQMAINISVLGIYQKQTEKLVGWLESEAVISLRHLLLLSSCFVLLSL